MARPKRTTAQREQDLAELLRLLRRGWTQRQAAERLGVAPSQIAYDWKVLLKRLQVEQMGDTEALRNQKVEQLLEVRREAWEAWERSKQDRERRTAETITETEGGGQPAGQTRTKAVKQVEGRLPEDAYLRTVIMTIQEEAKLDGCAAPLKIAPTTPDGTEPARTGTDQLLALLLSLPAPSGATALPGQSQAEPAPATGSATWSAANGVAPLPE